MLALGKEPCHFKDLEYQLNMYCQQWQADQLKQIIVKMVSKMTGKSNDGKRKTVSEILTTIMEVAVAVARAITVAGFVEEAAEAAAEEAIVTLTTVTHVAPRKKKTLQQ
jgi:hypothetical protein